MDTEKSKLKEGLESVKLVVDTIVSAVRGFVIYTIVSVTAMVERASEAIKPAMQVLFVVTGQSQSSEFFDTKKGKETMETEEKQSKGKQGEIYVGIDPGMKGGISVLDSNGKLIEVISMPKTEEAIVRYIQTFRQSAKVNFYLEKVSSMSKQGVKSTFTFGMGVGLLKGAIYSLNSDTLVEFYEVSPKEWQKKIYDKLLPEVFELEEKEKIINANLTAKNKAKGHDRAARRKELKYNSIKAAKKLFPDADLLPSLKCRVDSDGMAEALLIAKFGFERDGK